MYPSDQKTEPHRFADPIVSSRVSALQWGQETMRVGPGVIADSGSVSQERASGQSHRNTLVAPRWTADGLRRR
jgi:hypothetical protein